MPVSAETLALLMRKGIEGEDLLEIVRAIDRDGEDAAPTLTARQKRNQRYYDARKRLKASESTQNSDPERLKASEKASYSDAPRLKASEKRLKASEFSDDSDAGRLKASEFDPPARAPATLVESNLDSQELSPKKKPPTGVKKKGSFAEQPALKSYRGHRLPVDWSPSPADMALAVDKLGAERAQEILAEFRDFWLSEAGQRARKVSWDGTWRNRIRMLAAGYGPRSAQSRAPPRKSAMQIAAELNAQDARYERPHEGSEILPPDRDRSSAFDGSRPYAQHPRAGGFGSLDFGFSGSDLRAARSTSR